MLKLQYSLDDRPASLDVRDGTWIIGRADSCDIVLKHASISKQHARLDVRNGVAIVRDLLSRNGTHVNGRKVTEHQLSPGDTLRFGKIDVRLAMEGAGETMPDYVVRETPPEGLPEPMGFAAAASPHHEETPADGMFVPAVAAPAALPVRAVEVVKPDAAPAADDPAQKKKRLLIVGASTMLVVLALAIAFAPKPQGGGGPVGRRIVEYWPAVREGEMAFRSGDYSQAVTLWRQAEEEWSKANTTSSTRAAACFANVTAALVDARKGDLDTDWSAMQGALSDLLNSSRLPTDRERFVVDLMARVRDEFAAQKVYREAEQLRQAGSYREAMDKYLEISADSSYHQVVAERRRSCRLEAFGAMKQEALRLAELKRWQRAVQRAREALDVLEAPDAELDKGILQWEDNHKVETLVQQLRDQIAGDRLDEADMALQQLKRMDQSHYALLDLPLLEDQLASKLFLRRVQTLYSVWDVEGLANLRNEARARQPEAERLFARATQLLEHREKAEALFESQPFEALDHWQAIRDLEPDRDHPMNQYARGKMRDNTLETIGARLQQTAEQRMREENYREARQLLKTAAEKCQVDVSAKLDTLQETGKRLYNLGNNAWSRGETMLATRLWHRALDCFIPGEEWHDRVRGQIREKLGDSHQVPMP